MLVCTILSMLSYLAFGVTAIIGDGLPAGNMKNVVLVAACIFLATGIVLAGIVNDPKRFRDTGISEETYQELVKMLEEKKKQLENEAANCEHG